MIPTFIIDSPTMMLFGAIFARLNTQKLSGGGELLKSTWFFRGLILCALFTATAIWSYLRAPDWMWMYFLEDSHTSVPGLIYIVVVLYFFPYCLGYIWGIWAEQKRKNLSLLVIGAAVALNVYIMFATFSRYQVVGTLEEFRAGKAALLSGPNPVTLPMNLGAAAMVIFGIYCIVRFIKENRKVA
ncbi:MAG: hypothetical protein PHE84_12020 [bacterium]|nr:hypothetical protein [bacterium]